MYFDAPGAPFVGTTPAIERALIAAMALAISPVGWFALGPLGAATASAAKSLF